MCFSHAPWRASNDNKTHLYLFLNFLTGEKFSISENVNLSSFSFSQKDKFSFNIKEFLKFNPITFFDKRPVDASHKAQPLTLWP